ncbi:response regulator transcription factor [Amycolatopsis sp. NPDC051372]|uniref:response regulator transcription factor n=1 Tax=unclassified Amycolatopsis TaxID=2618356 RepID=UPI003416C975
MDQIAARPWYQPEEARVHVAGPDALTTTGLTMVLESHAGIARAREGTRPDVLVLATTQVNPGTMDELRTRRTCGVPVVLLTGEVPEASLLAMIEYGVVAIVDSKSADGAALADAVLGAARQHSVMPRETLRKLIRLVRQMQRDARDRMGVNSIGLTEREVEVLRLLADGAETSEIARELTYSESTIKLVLHSLTTRHNLRNRVHAVAFALRAGVL